MSHGPLACPKANRGKRQRSPAQNHLPTLDLIFQPSHRTVRCRQCADEDTNGWGKRNVINGRIGDFFIILFRQSQIDEGEFRCQPKTSRIPADQALAISRDLLRHAQSAKQLSSKCRLRHPVRLVSDKVLLLLRISQVGSGYLHYLCL